MLKIKLREALQSYQDRTGTKMTYEMLALEAGLKLTTIQAIATRPAYNTRLSTIDKLCQVLACGLDDLLELVPDEPAD